MFSNAIAGVAPMGGSGIYGSSHSDAQLPDGNIRAAGWFDGDIIMKRGNLLNDDGVVQAGKLIALNGFNGSFKGKSVKVEMGIITDVW